MSFFDKEIWIPFHITGIRMGRAGGGPRLAYVVLLGNRSPVRVSRRRWYRAWRALEKRYGAEVIPAQRG